MSAASCVVAVIQLRAAIAALWAAFGGNRYTVDLVSQVSLLLAGLAAFTYAIFLEGYYRDSVQAKSQPSEGGCALSAQARISRWLSGRGLVVLLRRFAMTMAIPLGVIALSLVLLEVGLRAIH